MADDAALTPVGIAAIAVEIALLLWGMWLLWRQVLSPAARSARGPARLEAWNVPPSDLLLALCLVVVGALVAAAAAGSLVRWRHLDRDASLVAGGAALHGGILAGLAGFHLSLRRRSGDAPIPAAGAFKSGIATFLLTLPIVIGVSNIWESLLLHLGLPAEKQDLVEILENTDSNALRAVLVIVATLLVPVTEELVFRAGLFRYLRTRIPRWASIAVSAILFGALHVDWSTLSGLASFLPLVVLAVIFCLAYERTGRIGTTMVAHALFNLNTFVLIAAGAGN